MLQTLRVQHGERFAGEGFKFNCAHDIPEPEAIKFAADHKILPIFVKSGQKKYVSGAIEWLNKQTKRNFKVYFKCHHSYFVIRQYLSHGCFLFPAMFLSTRLSFPTTRNINCSRNQNESWCRRGSLITGHLPLHVFDLLQVGLKYLTSPIAKQFKLIKILTSMIISGFTDESKVTSALVPKPRDLPTLFATFVARFLTSVRKRATICHGELALIFHLIVHSHPTLVSVTQIVASLKQIVVFRRLALEKDLNLSKYL